MRQRKHGLSQNDNKQILEDGVLILPSICLCPLAYDSGIRRRSIYTVSVHWFSASWQTEEEQEYQKHQKKAARIDYILHIPNRILRKVLGTVIYETLKRFIKNKKY